jgi:hypothetical protein
MNAPKKPNLMWHELNNSRAGSTAVIVGKGPSLDAWIQAGGPSQANIVTIGLNHAAAIGPCDYGITTHGDYPEFASIPTRWIIGLPLSNHNPRDRNRWRRKPWVTSWFVHTHENNDDLLAQTRDEISESRALWGRNNSGNNAVHLAHYLGATQLLFVGCEGTPEYAEACASMPGIRPLQAAASYHYPNYRRTNEHAAERLFGTRWSHWGAP